MVHVGLYAFCRVAVLSVFGRALRIAAMGLLEVGASMRVDFVNPSCLVISLGCRALGILGGGPQNPVQEMKWDGSKFYHSFQALVQNRGFRSWLLKKEQTGWSSDHIRQTSSEF